MREQIVVKVIEFGYSDILVETYRGEPVKGQVVATGPGRHRWRHYRGVKDGKSYHTIKESAHFTPTDVKVGDIVELGGLERNGIPFLQVKMDGALHLVLSEQDVAIVHEDSRETRQTAAQARNRVA